MCVCGNQKVLEPLELELQAFVSPVNIPGTKRRSSVRAMNVLTPLSHLSNQEIFMLGGASLSNL